MVLVYPWHTDYRQGPIVRESCLPIRTITNGAGAADRVLGLSLRVDSSLSVFFLEVADLLFRLFL